MKVLITSVRLPFGLDIVRKFGEERHEVYTAETFKTAPGNHSKFVKEHLIVPSPTYETRAFIDKLKDIITSRSIDLLVPCFEEAFYIAAHVHELLGFTSVFCASLDTLQRLHNKATFAELTRELGIPIPRIYTGVFVLGVFIAGLAGAVQAPVGSITLGMDMAVIIQAFCVVVIGGFGSLLGTLVGSLIVGEIYSFSILFWPQGALVLIFVVTAIILIVRPWGLFGTPMRV